MNPSFLVALAVLVAVAVAEDARSKKQAVYNPYTGPITDANKYLAAGVHGNNFFGYHLPQPFYQPAVYPSAAYNQQYVGHQQPYYVSPYVAQYNNQPLAYNNQPLAYNNQPLPYNYYQQPYPYVNNQLQFAAAIRQPVYPGALPLYPPVAHPFYYGSSSPYPTAITTTEANKPATDSTIHY